MGTARTIWQKREINPIVHSQMRQESQEVFLAQSYLEDSFLYAVQYSWVLFVKDN